MRDDEDESASKGAAILAFNRNDLDALVSHMKAANTVRLRFPNYHDLPLPLRGSRNAIEQAMQCYEKRHTGDLERVNPFGG